jgi:DNA modification methylase
MCLHGPDSLAELYLEAARKFKMNRIAWVNWHYRFGVCQRSNWIDTRCHCLIFAKNKKIHTWNPDEVLVDSDRATKYNDKRIDDHENGGKRLPGTVWGVPSDGPYWGRVQGNSKERRPNHPNQLPEVYIERLIRAYTNPGDHIFDPFWWIRNHGSRCGCVGASLCDDRYRPGRVQVNRTKGKGRGGEDMKAPYRLM